MKPLATIQQVLTWICICPVDEKTSQWKKVWFIIFTIALFSFIFIALASSYAFFTDKVSTDFEEALYALLQIMAYVGLSYVVITAFILRHDFTDFLATLSEIYEANEEYVEFLEEANNKSEVLWQYYSKLALSGFCVSTMAVAFISVVICFVVKREFDYKYFYIPYRTYLPWNQETLIGYAAMICTHIIFGEIYFFPNEAILVLYISICWYHRAFYKRFQNSLLKLDRLDQRTKANEILCEVVRFHNSVKYLFLKTSEVYSLIVLIQLICSMVVLSLCFFQLDLQLKHINFGFVLILTGSFASCANLFFYCYFGKMATESYEQMADCLFSSNWLELPVHLQKYFIIMIENTQRPLYYHGFGIANMKLETFSAMFRNVITCYMMFKTISKA